MIQANELTCIQQAGIRPRSLKTGETIGRAGKQNFKLIRFAVLNFKSLEGTFLTFLIFSGTLDLSTQVWSKKDVQK